MKEENKEMLHDTAEKAKKQIPKFFEIKKDKVDYASLNFFIKSLGVVLLTISIFILIGMLGDAFWRPMAQIFSILSPFVIAVVLAYLLQPTYNKKVARGVRPVKASVRVTLRALFISLILIFGLSIVIFVRLAPELAITPDGIISINRSGNVLYPMVKGTPIENFSFNAEFLAGGFTGIATATGSLLIKGVIILSSVIYLLPSFSKLNSAIKRAMPKKFRQTGTEIMDIITDSFSKYIKGAMKIAFFIGVSYFFALSALVVISSVIHAASGNYSDFILTIDLFRPQTILLVSLTVISLSVIGMVTNLIPYVGPVIGGIPIVLLIFLTEGSGANGIPWFTISALILVVVIQQFESSVLQPTIMGKMAQLHPVLILVGLTFFGALFGVLGMIISTPTMLMIKNMIHYVDKKFEIF